MSSTSQLHPLPATCASPLAPSSRPRFEVPAEACDCHAHVFGFAPRYPAGGDMRYTPAFDSQAIDYVHLLQSLGLQRAVIVQPTIYADNQVTLDGMAVLRAAGIEACGVARVEADVDAEEIARLDAAGMRGVRIHFRGATPPPDEATGLMRQLDGLAECIAPFGWHLQVHLEGSRLPGLRDWITNLPVPVVLDHFGRVDLRHGAGDRSYDTLMRLLEGGNCWAKLSAPYRFGAGDPPYDALREPVRTLMRCAPDRLLWGSDWPHSSFEGSMPADAALLDLLAFWTDDAALRHRILVTNPATLYRFARSA